jgi:hypothetical protein
LGVPVAPHQAFWDFTAMKRMAVEGEVPAQFRNQVRPVPAGGGDVWLVLTAEGEVHRYDATGSLQVRASIHDATMAATFDAYVRRNREDGRAFAFSGLSYVHDAIVNNNDLWLLLNVEEPAPPTILVLDREGMLVTRMEIPGISEANTFAIDRNRGQLILGLQQAAAIVAVTLP